MDKYELKGVSSLPSQTAWSRTGQIDSLQMKYAYGVSLEIDKEGGIVDLAMIGLSMISELETRIRDLTVVDLEAMKIIVHDVVRGIGEGIRIGVGILCLSENRLRVALSGDLGVYLLRDGGLHELLSSQDSVCGIVGQVKDKDLLMMSPSIMREKIDEQSDVVRIENVVRQAEDGSYWAVVCAKKQVELNKPVFSLSLPLLPKESNARLVKLGWVFLAIVLILIGIGFWRKNVASQESQWQILSDKIEVAKSEAVELSKSDVESAQSKLLMMASEVGEYEKKVSGKFRTRAVFARSEIEKMASSIVKQNEVTLETWIDLGILSLSRLPRSMIIDQGGIMMYVELGQKLVGIALVDRSQVEYEVSGQFDSFDDWCIDQGSIYGLNGSGLWGGKIDSQFAMQKLVEPDEAWNKPTRVVCFGGSLYVLDALSSEISKYTVDEMVASSRKRWFGKGILLDLSKIIDIKIDGDVWLLSSSGKLERYSRGVPVNFELSGIGGDDQIRLVDPIAIETTDEEVYLLERGKNRILVFDKQGAYKKQYVNNAFGKAVDVIVHEEKVFVLVNSLIMSFSL